MSETEISERLKDFVLPEIEESVKVAESLLKKFEALKTEAKEAEDLFLRYIIDRGTEEAEDCLEFWKHLSRSIKSCDNSLKEKESDDWRADAREILEDVKNGKEDDPFYTSMEYFEELYEDGFFEEDEEFLKAVQG